MPADAPQTTDPLSASRDERAAAFRAALADYSRHMTPREAAAVAAWQASSGLTPLRRVRVLLAAADAAGETDVR